MKIEIAPGRYVIGVSGGVDSTVLLDLLRLHPGVKLIVAHYDHGIRDDSAADRLFVQQLAQRYRLPFVYDAGHLGSGVSEAAARAARYTFLHATKRASGADALITAHHQDDVLETAIINLLRGTGRKGLSSLTSGEGIIRPLLQIPKSEILDYAKRHGLTWREDSTNAATHYLRNHVRHTILPTWSEADKQKLLALSRSMHEVNTEIDTMLGAELQPNLNKKWFIMLPHAVSREVMAAWLRKYDIREFDRSTIERLTVAAKVSEHGKSVDIIKGHRMHVSKDHLALSGPER